jgi:hypothetical protein
VNLDWSAASFADGYHVWAVGDAELIDRARAGTGSARGIDGCSPPAPAAEGRCVDRGAVPRDSPGIVYYQVRAVLGGVEGP